MTEGGTSRGRGDERHTDDDKVERLSSDVLDGSRHRCNAQFTIAAAALVTKVAAIPNSESEPEWSTKSTRKCVREGSDNIP